MATWTYTVFIDSTLAPLESDFGHAYISITSPDGVSRTVGYYPVTEGPGIKGIPGFQILGGPGVVRDDSTSGLTDDDIPTQHSYDYETAPKQISEQTAQRMLDYVEHVTEHPGQYGVFGNNCVQFVEDLMIIAGDRSRLSDVVPPFALKGQLEFFEKFSNNPFGPDASYDGLGNFIGNLQTQFGTAEQTRSPLILDLDGINGVETLGKSAGIHFDHDGNKFAEQSGWVGQNDGLLVWDRNGNNQIDDGAELFGNNTLLNNGSKAANGFTALDGLDSNHDHVIDAQDQDASNLRVFKDANANGVVDAGELLTLAEAGVQSLNTGYADQAVTDANGNQHLQAGSFTTTAGQTRAMDDVWFAVDTARRIDNDLVAVNDTIAALPDIEGFGNAHSLQQAMARDGSGKLQGLVQQYADASDAAVRARLLNDIIYRWAGVQDIDPASRAATMIYGNVIGDARKLATLETFLGQGYQGTWCWGEKDPNPHGQAAPILLGAYEQLAQWIDSQLLAQTLFKPLYESIGLRYNPDDQTLDWDVSAVVAMLKAQYNANPAQGLVMIASFAENLKHMEEAGIQISAMLRQQGNVQGQGFDLYLAALGGNLLAGTAGADILTGVDRSELFFGGRGADTIISSGGGNATYQWAKGDGDDVIRDCDWLTGDTDTLKLTDVSRDEVQLSRDGYSLYVTVTPTGEKIQMAYHFSDAAYKLERIEFASGDPLLLADLDAAPYRGTTGADVITGVGGNELFIGGKDADTILSDKGGSTTYQWAKGDGNDVIRDFDGQAGDTDTLKLIDVSRDEVQLSRAGHQQLCD
jgi:hypothetical protein